MSCNVGHIDHQNNVASVFLQTQSVEEVSAWDGSIVYNKEFGYRDYGFGRYVPGLAFNQDYFKSWVRDEMQFLFFKWKRAPYGKVNYRFDEKGEIVIDTWIRDRKVELNYSECTEGYSKACCEG